MIKTILCLQILLFLHHSVEGTTNNTIRADCITLLQLNGVLPQNNITNNNITTTPTNTTLTIQQCKDFLFGINGTVDWQLLPEYIPPTTQPPSTTVTTTLSPEEKKRRLCEWLKTYSYEFAACTNPCFSCVNNFLGYIKSYYECKEELYNGTHLAVRFKDEPMVLTLLMTQFVGQINGNYKPSECPYPPTYRDYTYYLIYSGKNYRYGDFIVPNYDSRNEIFKRKRWNRKNDSIEVPYGNLPRGQYSFEFVLYDHLIDPKILPEKTRFKEKWPEKHPIITGAFIDTRVEQNLYTNDRLLLNSMILSLAITSERALLPGEIPSGTYPLPGENIISFTHLDRELVNPVCVYWQPLDPGTSGVMADQGYWSNYGVRVFKSNHSMTVCRSIQYGSFAVLMEPAIPPPPDEIDPLDAMNVLLTFVAIILLILYLLGMVMLRCYMNHYSRLYMLVASSVLLAQVLYLVGIAVRSSWTGCTTIGTLLQFCHTSVMTWIFLEGIHQLSRIRYFFNEDTNIDAFYLILGFGFPTAVLVALQDYPYDDFDRLQFCWVYLAGGDLWFFGGPLIVLVISTLAVRLFTFLEIRKAPEKIEKDINYERAWKSIRASAAIVPTVVVLWAFGTWSVRDDKNGSDIGRIVVPILNIIVACEILYFYFYRNDEVRDALTDEMRVREKQKLLTYAHLRGLDMKVKYAGELDGDSIEGDQDISTHRESARNESDIYMTKNITSTV